MGFITHPKYTWSTGQCTMNIVVWFVQERTLFVMHSCLDLLLLLYIPFPKEFSSLTKKKSQLLCVYTIFRGCFCNVIFMHYLS